MAVVLRQNLVSRGKYNIKCPYSMKAESITVHNTWNDASAENEVKYMIGNNKKVSFHIAVDDKEAVQGIPLDRNAWHAGDGNGKGNRSSIGVEICHSKSGGERFAKAERNAAELIAGMLKERGWGIDRVKKHQDWSGKYCPHRTLDLGWQRFLNMVREYLGGKPAPSKPVAPQKPSKPSGNYTGNSIVEYLNSIGKNSSFHARRIYAAQYGIKNYTGTASQNTQLLNAMRRNRKPTASSYYPAFNSTSIVDGLKKIGVDNSFANRKKIAKANGIGNYKGTSVQNNKLCNLARQGKLKKA